MLRRRTVAWGIVALVLVAAVGYAAFVAFVSYRSAQSLVHPARETLDLTPADVGLAFEDAPLVTSDGLHLAGWWIPASNATASVIFLHGYGESRNQTLAYAPFLHDAGYNVGTFDFRAHGRSDGDHTTVGVDEVRDVRAAVADAKRRSAAPVALMGLSMGAATALNEAAEDADVAAVVSDSAFATLQNIAANSITHFTDLPKYPYGPVAVWFAERLVHEPISQDRPVDAAARLHVPLLVIQGEADDIAIAKDDGEAIHRAAPGSQYWLVPGAAHVRAHTVARGEYEARVVAFLDDALGGVSAPGGGAAARRAP